MRRRGFTLIELMIVVAIIGILAAIAIPKFASLLRKSNEGATRGSLGGIRSSLAIYYGDMEGQYPSDVNSLTIAGKYLGAFPRSAAPDYHPASAAIVQGDLASGWTDTGGWWYDHTPSDSIFGSIYVDCTHTDTKGSVWTTY